MSSKKAKKPWLKLVGSHETYPPISNIGVASRMDIPSDEKVVVKEVPAKVDGTVVGTAQIYEDGAVGVIIDDDAPQWAKDKIQGEADKLGYSIPEGGLNGST
jgi:hypothetical protein